jgi:DNA-binding transcriptional regulator YdaS (Cro superfamily)
MAKKSTPLAGSLRDAGSQEALAKRLGISRQRLKYWLDHRIPAEHVARVEAVLGVPRGVLRPDIFK